MPETEPRGERRLFCLTPCPALTLPPTACFSSPLFIHTLFLLSEAAQTTFKISSDCGRGEGLEGRGTARQASPWVFLLRNEPSTEGSLAPRAVRGAQRRSLRGNVGITLKSVSVVSGISPLTLFFFPRIWIVTPVCESKTRLDAGESGWHYCSVSL